MSATRIFDRFKRAFTMSPQFFDPEGLMQECDLRSPATQSAGPLVEESKSTFGAKYFVPEGSLNDEEYAPYKWPVAVEKSHLTTQATPSFASKTPVTHAQGFLRGAMVGMSVPLVTMPLDKLQLLVVKLPEGEVSVIATLTSNQPYKGYRLVASVSALRGCAVFASQPYIFDKVKFHVNDPHQAMLLSYIFSGNLEAIVASPYVVIKQRLMGTSVKTVKEACLELKKTGCVGKQLVSTSVTGMGKAIIFWPAYVDLVTRSEQGIEMVGRALHCPDGWLENGLRDFLAGGVSGAAAAGLSYPGDVVQKLMIESPKSTFSSIMRNAWAKHRYAMISEVLYRGFPTVPLRMFNAMGMTNLARHAADYTYNLDWKSCLLPLSVFAKRFVATPAPKQEVVSPVLDSDEWMKFMMCPR
jgi:hypothetical protein